MPVIDGSRDQLWKQRSDKFGFIRRGCPDPSDNTGPFVFEHRQRSIGFFHNPTLLVPLPEVDPNPRGP